MDFELKKPSRLKGFLKVLFLSIILSAITFGVLYYTNVITFKNNNNVVEEKQDNNDEKIDIFKKSNEEIEKIFQKKYGDFYDELQEGELYKTSITKDITINGSVLIGYKVNIAKIIDYFTEDCLNNIKKNYFYTDDNVNYYIVPGSKDYLNFKNTVFGVTNQGKRTLKLQLYDDDIVVFKSDYASNYGGEYVIYKKINDIWKIDMFE